jgi:hypothetical protein
MQTATDGGLRPATEDERRYTITCIHNADEHDDKGLVSKVSKQTPDGMYGILKKPDVNVTNAKDKETMLPKILEIDKDVIQGFKNGFKKLQSNQSPSQQPNSGKPAKAQVAPSDSTHCLQLNDQ